MRDFRDAKAMAQTLREALKAKSVAITHSESLELVAKILGFHDWNVLSARIVSTQRAAAQPATALPATALQPLPARAHLPALPLRDIVLFPQMIVPLFVGRDRSRRAVERAMENDGRILGITQRRSGDDDPARGDLYDIGVTASVIDLVTLDDGTIKLIAKSLERAAIVRVFDEGQFLTAETAPIQESRDQATAASALSLEVLENFQKSYPNINFSSPPFARLKNIRQPGTLADMIAPLLSIGIEQKQNLLETADVAARLEKILALMKADRQAA